MKGRFTIRTAGVLFALSAIVEIASIGVEVPLLGVLRGGLVAGAYHVAFAAVFLSIAIGLWTAAPWGARVVYLGTAIYTLDRVRYVLDRAGRESELLRQLAAYPEVLETFGAELLLQIGAVMALLFAACWWGFAIYIYVRRAYFAPAAAASST